MSQILTAPNKDDAEYTSVFLAGGISNCKEWQEEVIDYLKDEEVSLFNPRQEHFDVSDKSASRKQIKWEFERLEQMDVFSMYFCNDKSDQPICMYELGRNIVRMQNRFPSDWQNRIIISVEMGYRRAEDVLIQTELCAPCLFVDMVGSPEHHAQAIRKAVRKLQESF